MSIRLFFVPFFLLFNIAYCLEKLDGIAAVVGDEVILLSDLNAYTAIRLNNLGNTLDTHDTLSLKRKFLNEMIDGKILLVHGKKDSTISVTDEDVEEATTNHINMILKQNNLTLDSLEKELFRQQGISLVKFKNDARKIIREQLIKQKVQQTYLYNIKITRKDVENFYKDYKDSLPDLGESVYLSKLVIENTPSEKIKQQAYDKILKIKQKLDNGEDFSECARKFSESPDASEGGNIGFISKGTLNEIKFEEEAFSLNVGQISEPFETRLGFHIIKVLEKRDQQVNIQQIFISVNPSEEENKRNLSIIDSIRNNCKTLESFDNAIQKYSSSEASKKHGNMGWLSLYDLSPDIKNGIDSISVGMITKTFVNNNTLTVYRLNDRVKSRKISLKNDFALLENKAKDIVVQKKLIDLVNNWKKFIYIEIRI